MPAYRKGFVQDLPTTVCRCYYCSTVFIRASFPKFPEVYTIINRQSTTLIDETVDADELASSLQSYLFIYNDQRPNDKQLDWSFAVP